MSASLVGSEMCIRDRPKSADPQSARRARGQFFCGGDWGRPPRPPGGVTPCLLYTSDAADDM
eukprot:13200722-Alexandrium_andersonii.AAC.1